MSALTLISEHGCFGGVQRFYKHESREVRGPMKFSAYVPPQARTAKVPVLYYLSGLTCTEETFPIKAHAQQVAAELGADAHRAGYQPAGAAFAGRCRQLGLRLFGRFLRGCDASTLVAILPDVQLRHA